MKPSKHVNWKTYFRLIKYARPNLKRLFIGCLCGAAFGGSTAGLLMAARSVLQEVFQSAGIGRLLLVLGLLLLFGLVRGLGQFFGEYLVEWVGNRVVMDLRLETFAHLHNLPISFFSQRKTGELISRTLNDSMMIERAVSAVLGDLVKQPFVLIFAAGCLLYLDARLAFIMMILFPVCIVPVALFGRRVRRYARHGQERLAELVSIMQETLTGVRIVKAFRMEAYEAGRFREQCHLLFNRVMRVTLAKAAVEPIIVFISMCGLALVMLYARWATIPAPDFITFALAAVVMYDPVKKLSKIHMHIQQTSAAADRVFEILDAPATVTDAPNARVLGQPPIKIEFEKIWFAYEPDAPVLKDINLQVHAGERVALVGSSGAGKTTLVNLIPRFYDVTDGAIKINDIDLRQLRLADLRQQIGLVTQETFLFNDTVAGNIAYGCADTPRAAIEMAARRAHAHDFIMQMPAGYDTVVGERGLRLSGGQCQRLAIARAILHNPPILILDEATSALDTESERLVQAALNEVMTGRTVFAIAHRLSTIINSNKIIVLHQGRLAETGTHQELLALNGLYRKLYEIQFQSNS